MWGDVKVPTDWGIGLPPSGFKDGGPFWSLQLKTSANHVGVLIYKGDSTKGEEKAAGGCVLCVGITGGSEGARGQHGLM